MSHLAISYLVFGVVILAAILFDLGLFSNKGHVVTISRALYLTLFWVALALAFFLLLWNLDGRKVALEYLSAYMMEWSLSIDNIFVFVLIFTSFGIKPVYYGQILLIGILLAIVLRLVFISAGVVMVSQFPWILYVFGVILIYTGASMFFAKADKQIDLDRNVVYKWMKRVLPLTSADPAGKFTLRIANKRYFTKIFVVVVLLATTDVVFALDSIPAVFGLSQNKLVIYTSNIFAVLGLRSLFFLLKGAAAKFSHLQQGIAVVLVFVGLKMLSELIHIHIPIFVSLLVIIVCLGVAILYSLWSNKKKKQAAT